MLVVDFPLGQIKLNVRCTQVAHTVELRDNTMLAWEGIARLGSRLGSLCFRWDAAIPRV
jgi:hypothetical protein